MDLALIAIITLQVLAIMLQRFRNIINDIFSRRYATFGNILTSFEMAAPILRNRPTILLRHLKRMRRPLLPVPLIIPMVLVGRLNISYGSLTPTLFDTLIFGAAIKLLN